MARATLTIDLDALAANWRALDAMSTVETAAVVKADGYGLGIHRVGPALTAAGARTFFVALAEEGATLREIIGAGPRIFVFSGVMPGDEDAIRKGDLVPLLNSPGQLEAARKLAKVCEAPLKVGLQVDSGMNRLGFEPADLFAALAAVDVLDGLDLALVMSHLACADEPDHPQNAAQLASFQETTAHPLLAGAPRSLAATGGVILGAPYHLEMTRPGVGLYGGRPFAGAKPVVHLDVPIIQVRDVAAGETVGYGATYTAPSSRRIATISAGYADGVIRQMSNGFQVWANGRPIQAAGRVSMDLVTLDVTDHPELVEGAAVSLMGADQTIDDLADAAGTIGYEILTALGSRYDRRYRGI